MNWKSLFRLLAMFSLLEVLLAAPAGLLADGANHLLSRARRRLSTPADAGAHSFRLTPGLGQQAVQARRLGLHQPEVANEVAEVLEDGAAPGRAGLLNELLDHLAQVAAVGLHGFGIDPVDLHQLVVVLVDEGAVLVEHIGEAAGHARPEVDAGLAEHRHQAAGHVLAAVVAGPSITAWAPELRTPKRSPAVPAAKSLPPVAP